MLYKNYKQKAVYLYIYIYINVDNGSERFVAAGYPILGEDIMRQLRMSNTADLEHVFHVINAPDIRSAKRICRRMFALWYPPMLHRKFGDLSEAEEKFAHEQTIAYSNILDILNDKNPQQEAGRRRK
jgi:hypothetical protein